MFSFFKRKEEKKEKPKNLKLIALCLVYEVANADNDIDIREKDLILEKIKESIDVTVLTEKEIFDVIQEESSGVLGIGSRKAIIRVISKGEKYENKTDNSIDSPEDNLNIDVESVEKIFKEIVNHFIGDANIDSELNGKNI